VNFPGFSAFEGIFEVKTSAPLERMASLRISLFSIEKGMLFSKSISCPKTSSANLAGLRKFCQDASSGTFRSNLRELDGGKKNALELWEDKADSRSPH
jgi:hypothetical protein